MKNFIKENKFFIISLIIIALVFNIKLPYYINTPGGIIDISDRIVYDKLKDMNGSLNMLYVTEYKATIPTYLMSYIIKDWDIEKLEQNQISNESPEEIEIRNKVMLNNSIHNAIYVAYKAANKEVELKEQKNIVVGTTLDNGLKIGDELLTLNDSKIENTDNIKKAIQEKEIGEVLNFKIKRNNKEQTKEVEIKNMNGVKGIGVVVVNDYEIEIDPVIELKFKKSESGSSGGMMMALSIYTALSEEDILKGRNIAGTGTIDMSGNVGEISGIKYKMIGAVKNGMDVILVPSGNYEEAKQVKEEKNYDIELVKVTTFQDAIEYLKK